MEELAGQTGNDLLFGLFSEAEPLTELVTKWTSLADRIAARKPDFDLAERLLAMAAAAGMDDVPAHAATLQAIRSQRSLLDEPDPVVPVLKALGAALRSALHAAYAAHRDTLAGELGRLEKQPGWTGLPAEQRTELLAAAKVCGRAEPITGTDAELLVSLQSCDLAGWQTHLDAIPTRCHAALAAAIKQAQPKAHRVALPAATLKDEAEIDAWLAEARSLLTKAIQDGPAII